MSTITSSNQHLYISQASVIGRQAAHTPPELRWFLGKALTQATNFIFEVAPEDCFSSEVTSTSTSNCTIPVGFVQYDNNLSLRWRIN